MIRSSPKTRDGARWLRRATELARDGVRNNASAWHLLSLATVENGAPAVRTVGLRGVSEEPFGIEFWTDGRSLKVEHLSGGAAAMFWDETSGIQLRLNGSVETFGAGDERTGRLISKLPDAALRNYATLSAPGLPAKSADADDRDVTLAPANFLRCVLTAREADLVHLGDERDGRFRYTFAPFAWEEVVP